MAATGRASAHSADPKVRTLETARAPRALREDTREEPDTPKEPGEARHSIWSALKVLGAALVDLMHALWRPLHWLVRGLLIWAGIPIAVGVFGVSVAYHALGYYLETQAEASRQVMVQLAAMRKERRSLQAKLKSALAEAGTARDAVKKSGVAANSAAKELEAAKDELAVAREELAMLRAWLATRGRENRATTRKSISMPCDVAGPASGYAATLKKCLEQYNKSNRR